MLIKGALKTFTLVQLLFQGNVFVNLIQQSSKECITIYIILNKQSLPHKDLETVIHAFETSRLDYCNSLYCGLPQMAISRLQVVQNAAARLLTGTKKRDQISPILACLHWLPLKFRIDFKIAVFVYRALSGLAPKYISDLLISYSPQRALRFNNQLLWTVPRCRCKTKGGRTFSIVAPKLWNSLPVNVRLARSFTRKY